MFTAEELADDPELATSLLWDTVTAIVMTIVIRLVAGWIVNAIETSTAPGGEIQAELSKASAG